MLNVLATCFLSFAVTASSYTTTIEPHSLTSGYSDNTYVPEVSINTEAKEVASWRAPIIGRHEFVQITDYEYSGIQNIQKIGNMHNGNVFEDFEYEETVISVNSETVSTTVRFSSEISTGLQVQAGIEGASISSNNSVTNVYTIEKQVTYTASKTESYSVKYKAKPELINGKRFGLCMAAHVYKLTWQTWQVDDYWWGDYEVDGSRKIYTAYLTINPTVTIYYEDGTVLWDV